VGARKPTTARLVGAPISALGKEALSSSRPSFLDGESAVFNPVGQAAAFAWRPGV
jgi:hypothetical protein